MITKEAKFIESSPDCRKIRENEKYYEKLKLIMYVSFTAILGISATAATVLGILGIAPLGFGVALVMAAVLVLSSLALDWINDKMRELNHTPIDGFDGLVAIAVISAAFLPLSIFAFGLAGPLAALAAFGLGFGVVALGISLCVYNAFEDGKFPEPENTDMASPVIIVPIATKPMQEKTGNGLTDEVKPADAATNSNSAEKDIVDPSVICSSSTTLGSQPA